MRFHVEPWGAGSGIIKVDLVDHPQRSWAARFPRSVTTVQDGHISVAIPRVDRTMLSIHRISRKRSRCAIRFPVEFGSHQATQVGILGTAHATGHLPQPEWLHRSEFFDCPVFCHTFGVEVSGSVFDPLPLCFVLNIWSGAWRSALLPDKGKPFERVGRKATDP